MVGKQAGAKDKGKDGRRQVAALVWRRELDGSISILLMTSRETGRAVIPKGWPMREHADHKSAAIEAYEEAGILGKVAKKPIGQYRYWKRLDTRFIFLTVDVFALEAREMRTEFPEQGQRSMNWLAPNAAAMLVDEPDLAALIRSFSPKPAPALAPEDPPA
ncbi:hypothetical protein ABB55_11390 [Prosthecomicrobium hirschii]|uniref:Nudix hydrolase domain-containing protein n=1 Tax=Prosthecodimorpha hirschii TaxID=665126 RepID=A0A0P6VL91_9HYPH|nr:NUDIX hydrolase [Prosthecomicrobium hirschii]KPL52743.1 hypothetical protein ABB55_11390 [Prosthecomicrobium hirschii]